jgi:DNA polymerase III epsilon subunit-like protein
MADWDRNSAQIHGISLEDLAAEGIAADVALARLEAGIGDAMVVSDAPAFDNHWLSMIADAAGRSAKFEVRDWTLVLPTAQTDADRAALFAEARAHEPRLHRAAADARVMRAVWKASWDKANAEWA